MSESGRSLSCGCTVDSDKPCPYCWAETGRVLTPQEAAALAQARVNMRADLERLLAQHGLTPEQIAEFIAQVDEAGEHLRQATAPARKDES